MAEEIRKAGSMMICSRLILYPGVIIILSGTILFLLFLPALAVRELRRLTVTELLAIMAKKSKRFLSPRSEHCEPLLDSVSPRQ